MNLRQERQRGKEALDLIEEAVHLLRRTATAALASYYIGSLPFILGLLWFWADMSRSAFAASHCAEGAFGLSLLYLWMKCWQAVFADQLYTQLRMVPSGRWTLRRVARLVAAQSIIQPTSLFAIPFAAFLLLPFGWVYAFYHNASVLGNGERENVRAVWADSARQARLWPRQNHVLLAVLYVLFCPFVWFNASVGLVLIPHLLKTFLGVATVFTLSGLRILNSTFLVTTFGLTYLCLNPLLKSVYVLRCFYGQSFHSGEDLKVELRWIESRTAHTRETLVAVLAVALGLLSVVHANASVVTPGRVAPIPLVGVAAFLRNASSSIVEETRRFAEAPLHQDSRNSVSATGPPVLPAETSVSASALDRSIAEVLKQREYAWRMPRERQAVQKGMIESFLDGLWRWTRKCLKIAGESIDKLMDWLRRHWPGRKHARPGESNSWFDWMTAVQWLMILLLAVVVSALVIFFWRLWKQRHRPQEEVVSEAIRPKPNIEDDTTVASQLPTDEWLARAKELVATGELRLALRALHLASLAHLAQRELIQIATFKSNREYEIELRRRAHSHPHLLDAFAANVTLFERGWYGMHAVTEEIVNHFTANLERIRSDAAQ